MKLLAPGTVTVVCDLNLERAQKLAALSPGCAATDSVEQTVNSPQVDCVMIATLNAALAPIAKQALAAGKHVLAEKPGAISLREMEELGRSSPRCSPPAAPPASAIPPACPSRA